MKINRLYRLIELITMLRSGRRYGANDLAEQFRVSRRTIFRDLNILEEAGIPYYFDEETESYTIRKSFFLPAINLTIDEYFGNAWIMIPEEKRYNVELIFSPKVSRNVAEVHWHKTQECRFLDDGALSFKVTVDGLNEISWWILGYGNTVKVIKPKKLADMIKATAQKMIANYETNN